jgi:aminoglycoside phosphotransferase (APT) family kinase protein
MSRWLDRPQVDRFAEALSASAMGPRLATAVEGAKPCHVLDAKFEPDLRAVVLYERGGQLIRGDLVDLAPTGAEGRVVEPGVRLSPFPFDPDLPALPRVTNPRHLGPALATALGETEPAWRRHPERLALTVLRYRPGKRVTARLSHPLVDHRLVAKAYHDDAKASAVAAEAPQRNRAGAGLLTFAPTVAYAPGLGVVVQELVSGVALDSILSSRHPATAAAQCGVTRAATALAELHDLPLTTTRHRPVERELVRFGERAQRIATVHPELAEAATVLADRLIDLHRTLPPPRTGPVHGDCKPSQFLLSGESVILLDLDHLGIGDQAADVGTFIASLRQHAIRQRLAGRPRQDAAMDELAATFLGAYVQSGGGGDQLARIRWHVAVALERKALRAFARAPRSPLPAALIHDAQHALDALGKAA